MVQRVHGLVSVIMPCYNASDHIEEAIASVLAQTYREWELIIVDDGSTDGSFDVVNRLAKSNPGRVHAFRQLNQGPWVARNAALRKSCGEYIACLDADDYWSDDFLSLMLGPLSRGEADITYCGWQNFGEKAPGGKPYIPIAYELGDPVRIFLEGCPWPIHAALTKWEIFERLGGFSERHLRSMDYDFWLRTLSIGARYQRVAHVMAFYRWQGQGQMSDSKAIQAMNTQEIRERFVRNHPNLVAHIPGRERKHLMTSQSKRKAYELYWVDEMNGARVLFRNLFARNALELKDMRFLFISHLPRSLKKLLGHIKDRVLNDRPNFKQTHAK